MKRALKVHAKKPSYDVSPGVQRQEVRMGSPQFPIVFSSSLPFFENEKTLKTEEKSRNIVNAVGADTLGTISPMKIQIFQTTNTNFFGIQEEAGKP